MTRLFMKSIIIIAILTTISAMARWGTIEDADLIKYGQSVIRVSKNGTYTSETIIKYEVKTETGRKQIGTSTLQYNSRAGSLKVVEAYTINGTEKYPVLKEYIEDKAIFTSAEGFDQINSITIAFPRVEIGSTVVMKLISEIRETQIEGFYGNVFSFGKDSFAAEETYRVESEIPLNVSVNDPRKSLEVSTSQENKLNIVNIKLVKPMTEIVVSEKQPFVSDSIRTTVTVSSAKTYQEMITPLIKKYSDRINENLPEPFKKIAEKISNIKKGPDQINALTSLLSTEIRYMGDWRAVRGGFIPHPLQTIAKLKFADCKDFAVTIAAILKSLGYKTNVALVYRGAFLTELSKLPVLEAFNHAIAWVEWDKKSLWIDGTNLASFAQGIADDILGRQALILDPDNTRLEKIPEGVPKDSVLTKAYDLTFDSNGSAVLDTKISATGRSAMPWTGLGLRISKAVIDHALVDAISGDKLVLWHKVQDYDLSSRITKDLHLQAKIGVSNYAIKTSAGMAYMLEPFADVLINMDQKDRVSGLFLTWPSETKSTYTLKNVRKIGSKGLNCKIDSPWLNVTRQVSQKKEGVYIEDHVAFKKPYFTIKELQSDRFLTMQKHLSDCFFQVAVLFQKKSIK